MAKLKDGKTANITIRVTDELRKKVEALWERDYSAIPFNSFLGYLVAKGADEEEYIANYRLKRAEVRENGEVDIQRSLKFNPEFEIKRLDGRLGQIMEVLETGKSLNELRSSHGPASAFMKRKREEEFRAASEKEKKDEWFNKF